MLLILDEENLTVRSLDQLFFHCKTLGRINYKRQCMYWVSALYDTIVSRTIQPSLGLPSPPPHLVPVP